MARPTGASFFAILAPNSTSTENPEARPGRKMGHVCLMADSVEEALEGIEKLKAELTKKV
jgi:hypothetical protein